MPPLHQHMAGTHGVDGPCGASDVVCRPDGPVCQDFCLRDIGGDHKCLGYQKPYQGIDCFIRQEWISSLGPHYRVNYELLHTVGTEPV